MSSHVITDVCNSCTNGANKYYLFELSFDNGMDDALGLVYICDECIPVDNPDDILYTSKEKVLDVLRKAIGWIVSGATCIESGYTTRPDPSSFVGYTRTLDYVNSPAMYSIRNMRLTGWEDNEAQRIFAEYLSDENDEMFNEYERLLDKCLEAGIYSGDEEAIIEYIRRASRGDMDGWNEWFEEHKEYIADMQYYSKPMSMDDD